MESSASIFKTKKFLLPSLEFDVQVYDVHDAGLVVVAVPPPVKNTNVPSHLTRVFSKVELANAGVSRCIDGYTALVNSLSIVDLSTRYGTTSLDDASDTNNNSSSSTSTNTSSSSTSHHPSATGPHPNDLALDSSMPGMKAPRPVLTRKAAGNYLLNVLVNGARNTSTNRLSNGKLTELITKALTELCRQKPPGLEAVQWLGHWLLEHNPNQPQVHVGT